MPSKHEKLSLSPSAASRWLECKASPGFIVAHAAELPDESSDWADEGTQAHLVASQLLTDKTPDADTPADMLMHVKEYVAFVRDKIGAGTLLVEQKIPLFYQPERNGIVDSVGVGENSIYMTDLKYGVGVSVEAKDNPQLAIYAMSLIRHLEDMGIYEFTPDTLITLAIFQPRARSGPKVRLWTLTLDELAGFCSKIKDTAKAIIADPNNQPFSPSDDACRFCPAAAICTARTGLLLDALPPDVAEPIKAVMQLPDIGTLSPEQLGRVVALGAPIKKFLDDAREHAYKQAMSGLTIPGCKLVQGRTSRQWKDEAEALRLLKQKFNVDDYAPRELLSVAKTEKLLATQEIGPRFQRLIEANITINEGKPTLVSDDDPRPALDLNPANGFTALD